MGARRQSSVMTAPECVKCGESQGAEFPLLPKSGHRFGQICARCDEPSVLFPEIMVAITGEDGNAFNVLGAVMDAMRRQGVGQEAIDQFRADATAGDYDHLVQTVMRTVTVA